MNWLDVVLLVIVGLSVLTSFRKGLVREVVGIVSLVAGLVLGSWFYSYVAGFLMKYLSSPATAKFLGFMIVFCAVMIVGSIVRGILGKFLKVTGLSFFDHLLGAAFGVVRGLLIAVALLMAILAFAPKDQPPQSVTDSKFAPYVSEAAKVFVAMAPKELREGFHTAYAKAEEEWKKGVQDRIRPARKAEKGNQ